MAKWWFEDAARQLAKVTTQSPESRAKFQELVQPALDVVLGRKLTDTKSVEYDQKIKEDCGDYLFMAGLLRNKTFGEELPVSFCYPKEWRGEAVIWLHPDGKSALGGAGSPSEAVKQLLAAGKSVVGVDLLYQGEFLADGKPQDRARKVENTREAAAYSFGYNRTLFAQRVQDVLTVLAFVKQHEKNPQAITLVGLDGSAGAWASAARAQAGNVVTRAAIHTGGFRFQKVMDIYSPDFLPGGAKYGDLPGMLAVEASPLWLGGETEGEGNLVAAAFAAAGRPEEVRFTPGDANETRSAALAWLIQ